MAIVYDDAQVAQPAQPGLGQRVMEHPWIAVFIGLVLAVGVGYVIYQLRGQSATPSTSSSTAPGATGVNSAGQQVVYVPTSNTFLDYANYQDNNSPVTTTNITNNPPPAVPPPTITPKPIWGLTGSNPNSLWDSPYVVQSGDTLQSIAEKTNSLSKKQGREGALKGATISAADIYGKNKSNIDALNAEYGATDPNMIYPGQALWTPLQLQM